MIIFLIVFLVNTEVEDKINVIEENKDMSSSSSNLDSNFIGLKESVDSCLEKELKKSLIIAGARGGFIYDNGEYYFPGVWPDNLYSDNTIKNLGLTSSYLSKSTLVYSRGDNGFVPALDEKEENPSKNFEYTIKDEIQRFVLNEFIKCIDMQSIRDRGYEVYYEEFSGRIVNKNLDESLYVDGVIGKVNDTVKLDITSNEFYGKIVEVDTVLKRTKVNFSSSLTGVLIAFENLSVVNMNSSTKLEIIFQDEAVIAKLNFPITISKGNFSSSYQNSEVSVNVRIKQLLSLSKEFISYKYWYNHSLDVTDVNVLNSFINGEIGNGVPYFRDTENKNLYVIKTIFSNTDDYKAEVYTIVDYDSKIFGEPYIYNFGYENHAPVMDKALLNGVLSSEEKEEFSFIVPLKSSITYNLRDITKDPQFVDNNFWNSKYNKFYFKEQSYSSTDAKFNLYENGTMTFIAYTDKIFNYNVVVTDGETKSEYVFKFIVGFPNNIDNEDAMDCFKFIPFESDFFPIDSRVAGIFTYSESSKNKLYAYQNYINPASGISGNSNLYFGNGCIFEIDKQIVKYSQDGGAFQTLSSPYLINIPSNMQTPKNIKVNLYKSSGEILNAEPYEITIYPASCLGPAIDDNKILGMKNGNYFGDVSNVGTCCDINPILNSIEAKAPKAFIGSNNNLKSSGVIANPNMYFAFDLNSNLASTFDFQNEVIWDEYGSDATALYTAQVISSCSGIFPKLENNIQKIEFPGGSYDLSGNLVSYTTEGIGISPPVSIPVNLKKINSGNRCYFNVISKTSPLKLLVNANGQNIPFESGFISENSDSIYSGPIPSSGEGSDLLVLCSNNWFASSNSGSTWSNTGLVGNENDRGRVDKSKGYCAMGSNLCTGRVNSPTAQTIYDEQSQCENKYFDLGSGVTGNLEVSSNYAPSSWTCDTYTTCSGVCSAGCGGGPPDLTINEIQCSGSSFGCPSFASVSSCTSCISKISVDIIPKPATAPFTKLVCPS